MKTVLFSTAILVGSVVMSAAAPASLVTFDLTNQGDLQSSFSVVQDGVTLTFSNPQGTVRTPQSFRSDGDGLGIVGGSAASGWAISGWSFSFDTAVKLISFNVGYGSFFDGTLIYTPDSATGWTDVFKSSGSYNFSTQAVLGADENVDVAASITNGSASIQFSSITVDTDVPPVPLPGAVWGMIAGLGALAAAARRKSA